jgi:hypothetical protein
MRSNLPAHLNPEHPVLKQEYAVFTPPLGAMGNKLATGSINPTWLHLWAVAFWQITGSSGTGNRPEERFGKRIPLHI